MKLDLNPSNRWLSRIFPWHIGLALVEPLSKLFEPPQRLTQPYAREGQVVADLGCGRGYYTLSLAELVGQKGKVYAVDLDKNNIRALQKKADRGNYRNIQAHDGPASDLRFIEKGSVDFILANGLL
jgi:ubiquinone/menaquinone biosynthesis C-methylase UbiE